MVNSVEPDQLVLKIYSVCKGRIYLGSEGQGLMTEKLSFLTDNLRKQCRSDCILLCPDQSTQFASFSSSC